MEPPDDAGTLTLEIPSAAGDFVWAYGKGELRWPGRVIADADVPPEAAKEMPLDGHCVYVSFFGDGGAAWCDAGKLTPFRAGFRDLARQTDSKSFGKAVSAAVVAFGRYLEAEMTRRCVPESSSAVGKPVAEGFDAAEIVNGLPGEILRKVREFACDAMLGDALEVEVVQSWVAVFARWTGRYAPLAEYNYYHGLPQFKENAEENSHDEDGVGNGVELCEDDGTKKQRSMAELIAGLDLGVEEGEDEKWVDKLDVSRRRKKEEDPEINDLNIVIDGAEEGPGTGRRERKKSKYLSYPYTLVNMRGRRMFVNPKSSEKKSGNRDLEDPVDAALEEGQVEKTPRSRAAAKLRVNAYQDENEFSLNEKIPPVEELLTELHVVALDVMCLVGSDFDHPLRGFFRRLRRLVYTGDSEVRSDAKLQASPSNARRTLAAKNRGPVEEGKTPPQEGNGPIVEKGSKGKKKKKLSAAMNKFIRSKQRSNRKKKSIDGIVKSGNRKSMSSRGKKTTPATNASQKADGSGGGTSLQKRKRRKKDEVRDSHRANTNVGVAPVSDAALEANGTKEGKSIKKRNYMKKKKKEHASNEGALTLMASAGLEANSSEANKSVKKRRYTKKKEQASHDARLEQASKDVGLTPTVITGTDANISEPKPEANRSAENDGKEEVNGVVGSALTVHAADANVSGELTSVNIISTKEHVNAETVNIPSVPVVQEADGSGEAKSVGKPNRKKKSAVNGEVIPTGAAPGEGTPKKKMRRKKKDKTNAADGAVLGVPAFVDANVDSKPKQKRQRKKRDKTNAADGTVLAVPAFVDANVDSKPKQKRQRKKKEEAIATDGAVPAVSAFPDANGDIKPKQKWQRKKKEEAIATDGAVLAVPAFLDANGNGKPKQNWRRKKKEAIATEGAVLVVPAFPDANGGDKPKQKRQRKKKEETNAADGAVLAVLASPDASDGGKPKQKRQRRKKKEETTSDEGAALLLSFSNDVELPSKDDLISTYSKFGALRESGTALLKESVSASVVFVKKSDAEKAFNSPDRDRAFGNNLAACQLRYLHGDSSAPSLPLIPASTSKPPLEFVKKNLESMISTLTASGLSIKDVLGSDIGMKLDVKESLVDEMSGLLKKVNSMLTGGPSSASGGASAAGPTT